MAIRIPTNAKSERHAALKRCLKHVANEMGVSEFFAANFMTHFFEQLVDEVVDGQLVTVPGFGIFLPGINHRSKFKHYSHETRFCVPKFAASVGFRVQVKEECPEKKCREEDYQKYMRSSSPTIKSKQGIRPAKSLRRVREAMIEQADKVGMYAGPDRRDTRQIPGILP